ncbi:MAG: hypothetical protein OHK0038_26190 [Flammeovirgaceae bacterium]
MKKLFYLLIFLIFVLLGCDKGEEFTSKRSVIFYTQKLKNDENEMLNKLPKDLVELLLPFENNENSFLFTTSLKRFDISNTFPIKGKESLVKLKVKIDRLQKKLRDEYSKIELPSEYLKPDTAKFSEKEYLTKLRDGFSEEDTLYVFMYKGKNYDFLKNQPNISFHLIKDTESFRKKLASVLVQNPNASILVLYNVGFNLKSDIDGLSPAQIAILETEKLLEEKRKEKEKKKKELEMARKKLEEVNEKDDLTSTEKREITKNLRRTISDYEKQINELNEKIKQLEGEVLRLQSENSVLKSENKILTQRVKEQEDLISKAEQKISEKEREAELAKELTSKIVDIDNLIKKGNEKTEHLFFEEGELFIAEEKKANVFRKAGTRNSKVKADDAKEQIDAFKNAVRCYYFEALNRLENADQNNIIVIKKTKELNDKLQEKLKIYNELAKILNKKYSYDASKRDIHNNLEDFKDSLRKMSCEK